MLIRQFVAAAGIRAATVRARSIVEEARQQQSALIIAAKGEISRMRVAAEDGLRQEREQITAEAERSRLREVALGEREAFFAEREVSIAERERGLLEEPPAWNLLAPQ